MVEYEQIGLGELLEHPPVPLPASNSSLNSHRRGRSAITPFPLDFRCYLRPELGNCEVSSKSGEAHFKVAMQYARLCNYCVP